MDLLARANKPENMERTIKDLSREVSWAKILEGTSLFTTRGVRVFTDGEDLGLSLSCWRQVLALWISTWNASLCARLRLVTRVNYRLRKH